MGGGGSAGRKHRVFEGWIRFLSPEFVFLDDGGASTGTFQISFRGI